MTAPILQMRTTRFKETQRLAQGHQRADPLQPGVRTEPWGWEFGPNGLQASLSCRPAARHAVSASCAIGTPWALACVWAKRGRAPHRAHA